MTIKNLFASTMAITALSLAALAPISAEAQTARRQQTKNEWRNIGIASAVLGLYGLSKKDNTLTLVGIGGALYAADRYEKDRKSQNAMTRKRANFYANNVRWVDGKKYVRKTVWSKGKKYYKFVRA